MTVEIKAPLDTTTAKNAVELLRLYDLGFCPIPLQYRSKRPQAGDSWKQWQSERPDRATVEEWATTRRLSNWALLLAHGGIASLDIDSAPAKAEAEARGWLLPTAPNVQTARGLHVYFRIPSSEDLRTHTTTEAGCEISSGPRLSQIPPGVHPSGRLYLWLRRFPAALDDVPELPAELVELCRKSTPPPPERTAPVRFDPLDPDPYRDEALRRVLQDVVSAREGTRNQTLFAAACRFGQFVAAGRIPQAEARTRLAQAAAGTGLPEHEIEATIAGAFRRTASEPEYAGLRDDPPPEPSRKPTIPPDKAASQDENGAALDPEKEALLLRLTDSGNAEFFALLQGANVRFDHAKGRWLLWSGHHWAPDCDGEIRRLAKQAARTRYHAAADIEDHKKRQHVATWSIRSESKSRLDAALELAKSELPIADAGENWDSDPWLLGVANGVLDLRTGKLRPGRQSDRITLQTDIAYDPGAAAPRWERFLGEVFDEDQELVDFIQRAAGYSLTGRMDEQCLFFLYGRGANGKSVLLEALRFVLGTYAYSTDFAVFEAASASRHPEAVAELAGRRFVTASEVKERSRLHEGRLKSLAHGDFTSSRGLWEKRFQFRPQAKIWLGVNHKPRVEDDSTGFWRTIRLVPFARQFQGEDADLRLSEKLHAEASGILRWCLRGCLDWQRDGLRTPAIVEAATAEYRTESDVLLQFLEDCCEVAPGLEAPAARLYQAFRDWGEHAQRLPDRELLSRTTFGRRMTERFEKIKRNTVHYRGVGLRQTA